MKYILYLDDTRDPPWPGAQYDPMWDYVHAKWPEAKANDLTVCRTVEAAVVLIKSRGLPFFMSLDHDMPGCTGMDFLKWLQSDCPQGPIPHYHLHTANTVGRMNMEAFIESWRKSLSL